jgi:3-carboxymuconate cyclase
MTNEIESSVTVFEYDLEKKSFWRIQTTDVSRDQPMDAIIMPCDIHIHPSGHFLYLTNRGLNDLVVYEVDPESGKLTMKQIYPMHRSEPRGFCLTDDGKYLIIGSKDTDELETLAVSEDGTVSATGKTARMYTPCCVRILHG